MTNKQSPSKRVAFTGENEVIEPIIPESTEVYKRVTKIVHESCINILPDILK